MLNPDVTDLLDDPELGGGVAFTVVRQTRRRTLSAYQDEEVTPEKFTATGNIQPAQEEALNLLPEEDRSERVIVIRSTFVFQLGHDDGSEYVQPDFVIYDDAVWKVERMDHWTAWGFTVAYAVLQKGESPDELE